MRFYEDERVLRMSYEAQGVVRKLLFISDNNVGLPNDPQAIAELLGLPFRGLSVKRFLLKIWPQIASCWTAVDGRLFNEEQEARRAHDAADDVEPDAPASPTAGAAKREQHCRQMAVTRWARVRAEKDAAKHAGSNAGSSAAASTQAMPAALPPCTPSDQRSEATTPSEAREHDAASNAGSNAAGIGSRHAQASDPAGARAPHAKESEPQSGDDEEEIEAIARELEALPHFRTGLPGRLRSGSIREAVRKAWRTGFQLEYVAVLDRLDAERDEERKAPRGSSLGSWIKEGTWRDEVGRLKDRQLRGRGGGDSQEPRLAGSEIGSILRRVSAGGGA